MACWPTKSIEFGLRVWLSVFATLAGQRSHSVTCYSYSVGDADLGEICFDAEVYNARSARDDPQVYPGTLQSQSLIQEISPRDPSSITQDIQWKSCTTHLHCKRPN